MKSAAAQSTGLESTTVSAQAADGPCLSARTPMNKWVKFGRYEVGFSTPWHVGVLTCCAGCTIYSMGWLFVTVSDRECASTVSNED